MKFRNQLTTKPVIGMIHLMPLLGYPEFPGIKAVIKAALTDLQALEIGGVDAVMVENNYDVPHQIRVKPETVAIMTKIVNRVVEKSKVPVGVCVLWNDYRAALSIAKVTKAQFIRVPALADKVRTQYGDVKAIGTDLKKYQLYIGANHIKVLADIHVKHAQLLSQHTLTQSAKRAITFGADAIIITGKWTSDAPLIADLKTAKKIVNQPILIGSGATIQNIAKIAPYADGIIVGTGLKTGRKEKGNINVKSFKQRIDYKKVNQFMRKFKAVTERNL